MRPNNKDINKIVFYEIGILDWKIIICFHPDGDGYNKCMCAES